MGLLGTVVISNWGVYHKFSLGGVSTTPSGLYTRLRHTFIVKLTVNCLSLSEILNIYFSLLLTTLLNNLAPPYIHYPTSAISWSAVSV